MPDNPFSDPEIDRNIRVSILRLQAEALEVEDALRGRSLDDYIVGTLVDSLDCHARAYINKVDSEQLVAPFVDYLHKVGIALVRDAEQRSFRSNPYSDDRLRLKPENAGEFAIDRHRLTGEQQESAIPNPVERSKEANGPDATNWHNWHSQILSRIETRFEARFRFWEAHAIERAKAHKTGRLAEWVQRLQQFAYPEAFEHPWRNLVPLHRYSLLHETMVPGPSRQDSDLRPNDAGQSPCRAHRWEDIEIRFLSDERVQIIIGAKIETRNYAEMGFEDRRCGKPNQAWGILRTLARAGGCIPNSARQACDLAALGKNIERMRETLRKHFAISSDPVPLDPTRGYHCLFKIACSPSFHS